MERTLLPDVIFLHYGQLGIAPPVPRLDEMSNPELNRNFSVSS
jgi:hypothetical protein